MASESKYIWILIWISTSYYCLTVQHITHHTVQQSLEKRKKIRLHFTFYIFIITDWKVKNNSKIPMNSTWKNRIIDHIRPSTIAGLPSAISVALILTNLIWNKNYIHNLFNTTSSLIYSYFFLKDNNNCNNVNIGIINMHSVLLALVFFRLQQQMARL